VNRRRPLRATRLATLARTICRRARRLGLAKYKLQERIEVLEQFPLTRVGKVDKGELRQRIATLIATGEAPGEAP